jgi:carbonic anhydrase
MLRRRSPAFASFALIPLALVLAGNSPAHDKPHWSYGGEAGPEKWGDLSQEFQLCKAGHMQSPIDLGGADVLGNLSVKAAYKPGPLTVLNNGHTVQAVIAPGSLLTSGIARYKLLQVHFHTPSEEVLYGLPYPMVAHFVHTDHAGNLAVLGVLFEEGAHNAELEKLVRAAPKQESEAETVKGVAFDPAKLLPANLAVYRYEGSLTTPPCTEGVRWHVARHRATASAAQIAALHAIMGDNARPIQPLHGRLLVAGVD